MPASISCSGIGTETAGPEIDPTHLETLNAARRCYDPDARVDGRVVTGVRRSTPKHSGRSSMTSANLRLERGLRGQPAKG